MFNGNMILKLMNSSYVTNMDFDNENNNTNNKKLIKITEIVDNKLKHEKL